MQNVIDKIEWMFAGLGGFLGWFFGGFDGFLYALVVFVVCDSFTGVLAAAIKHELSSEVGFKGIAKKVCIFVLVGIANIIDTQILQNGAAIRTAVVFFYLANEGLSCLENAAVIGLPVPDKLKEMLAQLKEEKDVEKGIDFMLDILDDLLGEDTVDAITAERDVEPGDFVMVRITGAMDGDLTGEAVEELSEEE